MDANATQVAGSSTKTDTAGTRRCGAVHVSGATCDQELNHDRWAHSEQTVKVDGCGFIQVTVAWVDWDEVEPTVQAVIEQRRLSRDAR